MGVTEQFLKFALYGAEWVMYLLIACSVISLTIIIERIIFFLKIRGDFGEFIKGLTDRLNSAEPAEKIAAWCAGQPTLEANVACVGLERGKDSMVAVEESMNATMISARTRMSRGLSVLATLSNNSPFIGLFGTIIGIIQAFHALATTKSAGPEVVMASISEALVATAVGIMVAIPAALSFNLFSSSVKRRMANSETAARLVLTYFGRKESDAKA